MTDRFEHHAEGLDAPASHGFAIAPNDAAPLVETTRALYVGGAGDVALTLASGATLSFTGLAAGALLPVRATHVLDTGTTASDLVGLL